MERKQPPHLISAQWLAQQQGREQRVGQAACQLVLGFQSLAGRLHRHAIFVYPQCAREVAVSNPAELARQSTFPFEQPRLRASGKLHP